MSVSGTTAVIGLGLMGGSLARDLSASGVQVLAHDLDPRAIDEAVSAGFVHHPLDSTLRGVAAADLVILAAPVDAALDALASLAPHLRPAAVVTDVGSTKRAVADRARALGLGDRFVGSHPLAGDHRSGWRAARTGLYRGVRVFMCPGPAATPEAVARVESLWIGLGARPELVDAGEHDARMAWISHLPQVASSALGGTLWEAGIRPEDLGTGGQDVTRLAASSPAMWTAIGLANADYLGEAVARLTARLDAFREALEQGDRERLLKFFHEGRDGAG
jgi:prephenate dehydrogenase